MNDQPNTRIGDYEILGVLGSGGMGSVYKVRNIITDRVEAMKTLLPNLAGRQDLADRFLREVKLLAALNHPNIAALRTALMWENKLVMIMEYVEGVTLAARLEKNPIPPAEAVNYIDQVLSALGYAHSRQIIHRDIKPSNMMLTPQGVVKLMDFGIARSASDHTLTATGTTLGSLYYMSPEQVKGEAADARSDLYSVGVSLYELVTGKRPFEADSDFSLMAAHLQKEPISPRTVCPDLPAGLNDVILRAMAKDPAQRFQSAAEFSAALQRFAAAPADWQSTMAQTTLPSLHAALTSSPSAGAAPQPAPQTGLPNAAAEAATASSASAVQRPAPFPAPTAVPTLSASSPASPMAAPAVAQPVPPVTPPQPPAASAAVVSPQPASRHRGLYISLGAVIVLLILVGAGLYYPVLNRIRASSGAGSAEQVSAPAKPDTQAVAPAVVPSPASQSSSNPAPGNQAPNNEVPSSPAPSNGSAVPAKSAEPNASTAFAAAGKDSRAAAPFRRRSPLTAAGHEQASEGQPATAATSAPQPDKAELARLDHDMALLSTRADTVNAGLESLRQSQGAQGLGLRGDIVSSQARMKLYLDQAQRALQNQDAAGAKHYMDLADTEVSNLEKFLGQ
ncbi:MAG TPA: protein kinase [Terriglobales bacterium]|nr:protein kinase [Terriglobales bacterium]